MCTISTRIRTLGEANREEMFKSLSKSTWIMFLFDLIILCLSTYYWANIFGYTPKAVCILCGLVVPIGLIILFLKSNYKIREHNINFKNSYLLFEGIVMTHVLPVLYLVIFAASVTDTLRFIATNILTIFILLELYRIFYHLYLFKLKKFKNILILGTDERARLIADEIQSKAALKMNVAGFVQEGVNEEKNNEEFVFDGKTPVFVEPKSLVKIINDLNIDIVVIAQPTELILTIPAGIKIYKMPDFYEMVTGKYYVDEKTVTELYYQYATHRSLVYDFCKRCFDIYAALIILLVTLPITAYIAIRVKLIDGASPFFTQTRVGKDGKTFECYKLRTMYVNDYVPKDGEDVKYAESVKSDDRIIPFCKFVRKARFDEIPQMINILKGEMSIVGPRAEWVDEAHIFKKEIPYYSGRMWVKTGWTGWSHINMNPVFTVDEERERLEYDLYYIKHRNVLWEIGILIKAVFLACGGRHK